MPPSPRQISCRRAEAAGAGAPCTGQAVSGEQRERFCFPEVGLGAPRLGQSTPRDTTVDPTLNIDPTRAGVEPDIAFTGQDDKVVWTVWYEKDASAVPLRNKRDGVRREGGRQRSRRRRLPVVAVGSGTEGQSNVLDARARITSAPAPSRR